MALNPKTAVASRNLALDAAFDILNSGKFRGYDSTQPTDADTALGAQVLLFDCALNATAFAAAGSGSKAANAITNDSSADATGTLTWCSLLNSSNVRKMDMSAGTSGANANFNTVSIVAAGTVSITSCTVTQAA
jgi:hypothetical protein